MNSDLRRTLMGLSALALTVFAVSAFILRRFLPGPDTSLDYLVIGAVSVMLALASVFLVIMRVPHR
jgi:hypothetical protein